MIWVNRGSAPVTRLYVIRHGETDYNHDGRYQGHTDVRLNNKGREQSEALAKRMALLPFRLLYSSDLSRAQETARMIATGREVVLDPRLREVDVGRVAGLTNPEIAQREPQFWAALAHQPDLTPFPGGECAHDVQRRALEVFGVIGSRYPDGDVAVVTHGGLIKMLASHVLGLPLKERHRLLFDNCSLTIIEWGEDRMRVRALNDTGHLVQAPCDVRADF
jgi:broad specificity phosphatase PhoE